MVREKAKALPEADLISMAQSLPPDTVAKITERLEYTYQRVAEAKTQTLIDKGTKPLQEALANAQSTGNDYMVGMIQEKIANSKLMKSFLKLLLILILQKFTLTLYIHLNQ